MLVSLIKVANPGYTGGSLVGKSDLKMLARAHVENLRQSSARGQKDISP